MATIYSYNSNNRYCTYELSMVRSGSTVTITASGKIYTENTSGGDSSGTVYAQLRYGVSPAQTATNPAKNSTAAQTYVTDYGTLVSNATGTGDNQGWTIRSVVTKGNTTNTYSSTKIVTGPVDNSSSPSNPYNFTITWTKTTNNAINWSNVALFFSKDQTNITAGDYPSYAFIGTKGSLNANYARYHTDSLSVGVGYSKATAPSSVSTSVSLQKPGSSVVISWSGAAGGSSNSIKGYQVYGGTSQNPTTLLATVSSTSTSSSYTYTIPSSATRGNTYYFRVRTTGSAGSSYYSGYSSQVSCKVNTLPTLSTCSANKSIIARNSATSVKFTLTGAANEGTLSFRYSTSNSTSSTTAITSGTSLSVAAGTSNVTYYFWAYDGLEYSTSQSVTLIRNTVPTAPTVSATKTVVKSSGDNVTFTLTATAENTGQSVSYYYATSASGTKNTFTSGSTINVKATTTYYFWAYDGLDYSSSSNKTITVNTPPTYSNTVMGGGTLYNSQILSTEQNKIFRLNDTASLTASTSTGGTLTYQWYYQMSDLSGNAVVGNTSATWNTISGNTSSCSTNSDTFKTRGKIYRLKCRITDQLGDYTDVIYVWRIVAPVPTITMVGNAGSASSPSYVDNQSNSKSFKDILIFNVSYDSSLSGAISSSPSPSISPNNSVTIAVNSVSYGAITHNVAFTTSGIQKDTSYTISFTMVGETGAPSAEMSATLSTAADPVGLTLEQTYSTNPFKPFSGGDNKYSFTLNGINQTNYNLNSNNNTVTEIVLKYGDNTKSISFERDTSTSTGNYLILKFRQDQILDDNFIPETDWNTNQTITINSITMNDIFEFSHTINFTSNNSILVTFQEGLITNSTSINSINGKTADNTYNTYYIYEGTNQLTYNLSYAAYNTNQQVSCEAYIYRSNSIIDSTSISNWGNAYATTTFTTGSTRTGSIVSENKNISFNVNQVSNSQYLYFKMVLKLNDIPTEIIYSSDVIEFKGVKHIEPTAIITSTISGDNTIITLKSSNSGADPTDKMRQSDGYQVGLQFSETNTFNTNTIKYLKINNGIGSLTNGDDYQNILSPSGTPFGDEIPLAQFNTEGSFGENWERYYVRLIYRTFDPNSLEKIGYSSPITIFNMFPTVSYRSNRVGINTKRVDEFTSNTGSIIIGAMNENSKIFILKTGQTQATVDLTTGNIEGFILDGGSW